MAVLNVVPGATIEIDDRIDNSTHRALQSVAHTATNTPSRQTLLICLTKVSLHNLGECPVIESAGTNRPFWA